MNILPAISVTADALSVEKTRLEVIGQNIANAQTTRGPDGLPYQRKIVTFETQLRQATGADGSPTLSGLRVAAITSDKSPGQRIHNPGHPHADASGMVELPNVSLPREMVDLVTASRAYEANLSVVRTSRQMAMRALQIGK